MHRSLRIPAFPSVLLPAFVETVALTVLPDAPDDDPAHVEVAAARVDGTPVEGEAAGPGGRR